MKLLGYVSDEKAKTMMRDCRDFLFPTLYEGFGMPPLEDTSAGAKCIVVSDTEVMHELFGNTVNYINPRKLTSDLSKLSTATEKDEIEILSKFSWQKSAEQLKRILN